MFWRWGSIKIRFWVFHNWSADLSRSLLVAGTPFFPRTCQNCFNGPFNSLRFSFVLIADIDNPFEFEDPRSARKGRSGLLWEITRQDGCGFKCSGPPIRITPLRVGNNLARDISGMTSARLSTGTSTCLVARHHFMAQSTPRY